MKIWNNAQLNGRRYLTVEIEPAKLGFYGMYEGGMYVRFWFDQNRTEARWMYFEHSGEQIGGLIGTWDRVLTEEECLGFCEENYGGDETCPEK